MAKLAAKNSPQSLRSKYLELLRRGLSQAADELIEGALAGSSLEPEQIYLEVLMPAQRSIGRLWASGDLSVAEEHRATQITLAQMDILRRAMKPLERSGKRAITACHPDDPHAIPCRVVTDFLNRDGWTVDCIGCCPPVEEFVAFVHQNAPDLIAFSATMIDGAQGLRTYIEAVKRDKPDLPIVVGGAAFAAQPELLDDLGHDAFARDILEAVQISRELVGLPNRTTDLDTLLTLIGRRIQELRARKGLRQQDLAEKAQLDRAYLSTLEHGKQNLTIGAMLKLANALHVDVAELVRADGPSTI